MLFSRNLLPKCEIKLKAHQNNILAAPFGVGLVCLTRLTDKDLIICDRSLSIISLSYLVSRQTCIDFFPKYCQFQVEIRSSIGFIVIFNLNLTISFFRFKTRTSTGIYVLLLTLSAELRSSPQFVSSKKIQFGRESQFESAVRFGISDLSSFAVR